ncbi:MAG TPA: autotransporter domain-containing protein [Sedimentisphaerales bacterium]|nr:autotransporter domain-containing protein [Sedimentisphaerales bacterium]HRS10683.1 autotransporter domain-containing protein [Sedimentisphaerales bacterium]HRV47388.1 autotransporter domain-containing protein [Sedimentisphaerales bacterium]
MKTNPGILGIVLCLVILSGSAVRGAGPMGPPIATLEEGRWTVGLEYGYAETDLRAHGTCLTMPEGEDAIYSAEHVEIRGLTTRMVFGSLAYGVVDTWDLFLRIGVADAQDHANVHTTPFGGSARRFNYDGGYGLAYGIGSRATFCHWGPWQFGGTMQVTWLDPGESDLVWSDPEVPGSTEIGSMDIDIWQAQMALAATYQIDTVRFWAGPFLQFVQGDFDRRGETFTDGLSTGHVTCSSDIEETSHVGVHFGMIWEASNRTSCWVEGQYTRNSWVFGVGAAIQPEQFLRGR